MGLGLGLMGKFSMLIHNSLFESCLCVNMFNMFIHALLFMKQSVGKCK